MTHLLWPLLSSGAPSPPLTGQVAQWQRARLPRVRRVTFTLMPAAFTSTPSVQVWGFDDRCRLTRCDRLLCDSCSSGQCFACGFLQIPPRGGHPCRPASGSPCRAHRGLTPPSHPVSTTWTGTAPSRRYAPCLAHNATNPGKTGVRQQSGTTVKVVLFYIWRAANSANALATGPGAATWGT